MRARRACPTGGQREGVEGVWQWLLANTKDPLATHFPSAPLSPPQINTLVVFIPGCSVSLSVGVTICSEGQTHKCAVTAARPHPCSGVGGMSPQHPRRWPVGRGGDSSNTTHSGARRGSPSEADSPACALQPTVVPALSSA